MNVWCVWFALVMGAPYAPLGASDYTVAIGPASLSNMVMWAALGMALGLWAQTYPDVRGFFDRHGNVRRAAVTVGLVLSLLVVGCSWANTGLLWLGSAEGVNMWGEQRLAGLAAAARVGMGLVGGVLGHGAIFVTAGALLCGLCAPAPRVRVPRNPSLGVLACGAGLVQPLALLLLFPHAGFPQPSLLGEALVAASLWEAPTPLRAAAALVPTVLLAGLAAWSVRAVAPGRVLGALCLGELGFFALLGLFPDWYEVDLPVVLVAAALYVAALALLAVCARRCARDAEPAAPEAEAAPPDRLDDAGELLEVLAPRGRSLLDARGLSEREVLVVCAYVRGLTAAQTGTLLGIGESTVREYRRRIRTKLGVGSLDEVLGLLQDGRPAAQGEAGAHRAALRRYAPVAVLCALAGSAVLLLLPWDGAGIGTGAGVALGVGAGLALACAAGSPAPRPAALLVRLTLWIAGLAGLVAARGGTGPAVQVCCAALCTAGAVGLALCAGRALAEPERATAPVWAALAICAALFCGGVGQAAWLAGALACGGLGCAGVLAVVAAGGACAPAPADGWAAARWQGFAWSAAAFVVALLWIVTWFGTAPGIVVILLRLAGLGMAVAAARHAGLAERARFSQLAALVGVGVVALCAGGLSTALLAALLVVGCIAVADGPAADARAASWVGPLCATALGVVAGVSAALSLAAFAAPATGPWQDVMGYVAWGTALALAVIACLAEPVPGDGASINLAPSAQQRAETFLVYRGLAPAQAHMARRLFEGASVREVAGELGYAESTVRLARRTAYELLHVQTHTQFVDALNRSLEV
jgi:DNA-binding NarL/FixJ family response regulator